MYTLETIKGSNYSLRFSEKLNALYLKRLSATKFPSHYGRIDKEQTSEDNASDFWLISDRVFPPGIILPEELTLTIGTFKCIDERKQEIDHKRVIGLRGQLQNYPLHALITELDNIRSFLITLRGTFRVIDFIPSKACPLKIQELYKAVDWKNQSYWPTTLSTTFEEDYPHNSNIEKKHS